MGMDLAFSRRSALLAASAALVASGSARAQIDALTAMEEQLGGKIGLYAVHLQTGAVLSHRSDERFAMCSTFKAPLAGLVLQDIAAGKREASDTLTFQESDLVSYSPAVKPRLEQGVPYMSLHSLCDAVVRLSDNTAANLLLDEVGGPAGFTARVRAIIGSEDIRLDRYELELNENKPGDPRDTTTPRAMTALLRRMLFDGALHASAAQTLRAMMIDCATGLSRLRAGLPSELVAGDKTGTSANGLFGDNAFVLSSENKPLLLVSCYVNAKGVSMKAGNAAHADIGRLVAERLLS